MVVTLAAPIAPDHHQLIVEIERSNKDKNREKIVSVMSREKRW
jgi:hypothetical protein